MIDPTTQDIWDDTGRSDGESPKARRDRSSSADPTTSLSIWATWSGSSWSATTGLER